MNKKTFHLFEVWFVERCLFMLGLLAVVLLLSGIVWVVLQQVRVQSVALVNCWKNCDKQKYTYLYTTKPTPLLKGGECWCETQAHPVQTDYQGDETP
jgi:hypothetical protein